MALNFSKICIVCLEESETLSSIFECDNDEISVEEKIIKCFPALLPTVQPDNFQICESCLDDLEIAYRFYKNCEKSMVILQSVINQDEAKCHTEEAKEEDQTSDGILALEDIDEACYDSLSELEQVDYDYKKELEDEESKTLLKNTLEERRKKGVKKNPKEKKLPKICELCGNSYKYQHALNAHMRRHKNDRPFSCEFCEKAFVSNVELRRHMRVHTGVKPYSCNFCDRRFSDFGSRIKHERTHTGERPFVCTTCNKSFAYAHVLSVHKRIHTGEKKFQCTQCRKGFTKKAYLLSHTEQHHQGLTLKMNRKEQQQKKRNLRTSQENSDESIGNTFILEDISEDIGKIHTLHEICEDNQTGGVKFNEYILP